MTVHRVDTWAQVGVMGAIHDEGVVGLSGAGRTAHATHLQVVYEYSDGASTEWEVASVTLIAHGPVKTSWSVENPGTRDLAEPLQRFVDEHRPQHKP